MSSLTVSILDNSSTIICILLQHSVDIFTVANHAFAPGLRRKVFSILTGDSPGPITIVVVLQVLAEGHNI